MSRATFQLAYDGEAVRAGSMDVHELAPALLAVGDLVRHANSILNGEQATASVRVQSDFRHGSFEINLILDQNLIEQAKNLLFGRDVADAAALVRALFGGASAATAVIAGVLKILKMLKGEKPKQITIIDNSTTIIQTGSGQILQGVDRISAELYQVDAVREAAERVIQPLRKPGFDSLEVKQAGERIEYISKGEALEVPQGEEEQPETALINTREALLKIVKVSFEPNQKWRFSDGTATFGAAVHDKSFQDRVQSRQEGFFSGDILRVVLKTSQHSKEDGSFKSECIIARVVEHLPAPQQRRLRLPEA